MLLAVLQDLLQQYRETGLEIPPTNNAMETLIAASKFGEMSARQHSLAIAAKLQNDPAQTHLQAAIAHRQSVLLRFNGDISGSQRVLQEFLDRPQPKPNPKLHSLLGLLHLSQAENWAYRLHHPKVYEEAQKWELLSDCPSSMQLYVLRTKLRAVGQSYKGDGLFNDAKSSFEGCLTTTKPTDSNRFLPSPT